MFMVSVAKPRLICGYHGLTIVIMFFGFIHILYIEFMQKKLPPEIVIFSWDVAELRILSRFESKFRTYLYSCYVK